MRTKLALKNTITSLILQLVLALSGFIIPRFFTELYGSSMNGLVNSISQFISYINLVEAGISASVIVSLYKPIAENDTSQINRVLAAAKKFYRKSGFLFLLLVGLLILVYPYVIKNEISNSTFIRMMIFVLSISGLVDYFILGKYRVLLQADQRSYVISYAQIVGTVIMTIVSIVQIKLECSALAVKFTAASIYILRSLIVVFYARRKYKYLNFNVEPDNSSMNRRWSALIHQIAGMITTNTDMLLLTLMVKTNALIQVSIYSTYNLVSYALINLMNSFTSGLTSSFGQVISQEDHESLKRNFSIYEFAFFIIIFIVYSCMGILLYSFIYLYTKSYSDANIYLNWNYVLLFTIVGIIQSIRQPALTIICAAGHYKETQYRAILEAVLNLSVSLFLVGKLGISGVLIGTIVSFSYRSLDVIFYNNKYLISKTLKTTINRLLRNVIVFVIVMVFFKTISYNVTSWGGWFIYAIITAVVSSVLIIGVNFLFERELFMSVIKRGLRIVKKN